MKNLHYMALTAMLTLATACHKGRHTTIERNTNGRYVKIEYSGNIYLNSDATAIKNISPGGYVLYEDNDENVIAQRDHDGRLCYEINGGHKQLSLDKEGQRMITLAVKEIVKHPHYEY